MKRSERWLQQVLSDPFSEQERIDGERLARSLRVGLGVLAIIWYWLLFM